MMDRHAILIGLRGTLPELLLAGAILVVILADLTRLKRAAGLLALLGLALAAVEAFKLLSHPPEAVFARAYAVDGVSAFFKLTFVGAAFLVGILSIPAIRGWSSGKGEFFALLLSCTFGMLLMSSANDLLLMYLSLEF